MKNIHTKAFCPLASCRIRRFFELIDFAITIFFLPASVPRLLHSKLLSSAAVSWIFRRRLLLSLFFQLYIYIHGISSALF